MKLKTLIAAAAAAALALPLSTLGAGDKVSPASGAASSGASADGGAEAMFKALDKNTDGSISKDEAKGTPHDKDFAKLDKNRDGKLSRQEYAAAPEHAGAASSSSGAGSTGAKPGSKY
jgi:hypothetical protein